MATQAYKGELVLEITDGKETIFADFRTPHGTRLKRQEIVLAAPAVQSEPDKAPEEEESGKKKRAPKE